MIDRFVFKRTSLLELRNLIVQKESEGYECVKKCFKEEYVKKKYVERGKKWLYDGDEVITKWVVVMKPKEGENSESRDKGKRHSVAVYREGNSGEARRALH